VTALFESLRSPASFYPLFIGLIAAWLGLRWWIRRAIGARRWERVSQWAERLVLMLFILSMLILAMLQIVLRNLFHTGLVWIDPLLRHLVLWIGVTGAVVATGRLRHIQMDVIGRMLPPGPRVLAARLTTLVAAGICAVLAHAAWVYLGEEARFGSTGFLGIPTWVLTCILFIGFALMAARFASRGFAARETLATLLAQREAPISTEAGSDA
jgi:TRAP-type C4-dicarboxylate transport system permease small subunit